MIKVLITCFFSLHIFAQNELQNAHQLYSSGKVLEADNRVSQYLESYPNDVQALELKGDICGRRKDWDCAIRHYQKVKQLKPGEADFHYKYGGALGMKAKTVNKFKALGMIGDIRGSFEKAIKLDPRHLEARWALIELNLQLPAIAGGSLAKARQYANELARLSAVDGCLAHARIDEHQDDFSSAEKNYKLAWDKYDSVTAAKKLAALYQKMNKPQKAQAILRALDK